MKADKRAERLAKLLGLDVPVKPTAEQLRQKDNVSREMEAVLAYADNPKGFLLRQCKRCDRSFGVNRANIAFCSDDCRVRSLHDRGLLVNLDARTPEERWASATGGREPLIVPPSALELLPQSQPVEPQPTLPDRASEADSDDWLASVIG